MTLGGLSHALTPLAAAASPLVHVVDAPAEFLGALWLPFRRDHWELQAALAQSGPITAVFGHADVVRFGNRTHASCRESGMSRPTMWLRCMRVSALD